MSRVIEQIATVQFQVNARQANAAMQALQEASNDLNRAIDSVNRNIANLGKDVPKDNPQLLNYQNQLKGLQKDLKDVEKAQRDFLKGAKAADQLWKAAQEQNIETLSMRSIKAGVSGLRKRQENLSADKSDPNNMRDFRIIQQVIDESERLMKDFRADVDNTIQVIRDGGTVSVQSMRNALKAAEELRDSVEEGTGEWRDYQQQVEFMTKSLDEYNAAQRRMKGELVDSNDARREALKLTEDGDRAAAKERELADAVIASTHQQINDYQQLRKFQQERIDKTEEEISINLRLQEAEHARLAEIDKNMRDVEAEDRRSAKSYRDRSESASNSADWLDVIARNRDNEANQLRERVQNTQAEVNAINSRIEALKQSANATKKNSKAYKELQELQGQLKDKTKELNTQTKDYEKALDRATKAQQRANEKQAEAVQLRAKAESFDDKVAHAGENREKVLEREAQKIRELYMQYDQLDSRLKKERAEQAATDRAMIDAGNQQAAAEGRKAQAQVATIKSISNAIKILEEQNEVIDQNSKEWQENTAIIQRLQERLNEMKVAPALQMMTERMEHVPQLSEAALQETKKFWEAMVAGAEKGSKELAIYEGNLKVIAEEERQRSRETLKASSDRLTKGGFGQMTTEQLRQSIEDAKKYQLTLKSTSEEAQKLSVAITDAEEHIKRHGIEAERAARKQEEANKKAERATRDQLQAEQDLTETMRRRITVDSKSGVSNIQRLSTDALAETKKYWEAVRDGAEQGTAAYKQAALAVKLLANEEQRRKDLATSENIAAQMSDLNNLSVTGLDEVKRYWQAMADGAKRGSDEAKEAEDALKRINALESERSTTALKASADRLSGNLGLMSQGDIRQAIEDAKKYQLTLGSTSEEAKKLAQAIVNAEEHLKRYGVEAERAARKQEEDNKKAERAARDKEEVEAKAQQDQLRMMRERIVFEKQRQSLSADALTETKKYWEAVARGANEGSWAQKNALTMMERITAEEERRAKKKNVEKADRLIGTRYLTLSESELRESIEAAKELQKELAPTDDLYKRLSAQIVKAEEHIKSYGVEAQRAAVRQAESISLMQQQLQQGTDLSESALKAQQSFWQRLIDDPKTASENLDEYRNNLQRSIDLQKDIAETTRRMAGEIVTVNDAMKLSNNLTKENAEERLRLANIEKEEATNARTILEGSRDGAKQRMEAAEQELSVVDKELAKQRELSGALQEAERLRAELPKAQDEYTDALHQSIKEKGEWIKLNDEVIKATVKVDELKEKLANTSNLKEQLKIREELKKAEDELTDAQIKADEQSEKLTKTREKQYAVEDKINKITEESKKVLGGRDYDTERDKLDNLERKHVQLSQTLTEEKRQYEGLSQAVVTAQEMEKNAAIELAQAEKASQQSIEEAIAVLEKQQKVTTDESEYNKQAEALDKLKQKLKETTGEWMKYDDAVELASKAGGEGFIATSQQMQQAVQAMERQRDSLIKTIQLKRKNGEATTEEEAKLETLEQELKDLKFEQDNFNMSHEKMEHLLKEPVRADNLDELRAAIKRADGELKRMEGSLGQNNAQYKAFAEQVRNAKNQLKEMEGQAKASATAWEKAWSRLKTYVVMYMGFNAVWQKMVGTADDLMQLSDKMGEVRKTTGFTADEVGRLSDSLKKLDTRTTITGLLDLSVAAGQLGLKTQEDVEGFTIAANKLMVALPEMGKEGATEMLKVALATGEIDKIRRQMEQGLIDGSSATAVAMEKVGSTIDRLRATSAATAPAITDFVKRVGAVGAQSGISIDQVAALGSTVDALGMRVEMSATALSRMIPAIKNNAFDVAKAIGVTPNTLRELFETGRGMEAILLIFQKIKDSGMGADDIDKMLGMGNMKEVMKELNQQGARAGIVFAGLSQNVDTLRAHLNTAKTAYEENIAITQEYEKMNETTAAKWERLKNEIEEWFVGDGMQSFLGGIIDGIREIVNLITGPLKGAAAGLGAGLGTYKLGLGGLLEKMWDFARGEEDVTEKWKEWTEKLKDKDVWGIVTSGVIAASVAIYTYIDSLQEAAREAAKFARDVVDEQNKVENLTKAIGDAKTKVEEADKEVEKARKAVDEAKKSLDGTKESTDRLTEANSKLLVSEEKKRNEMATQKKLIETFNNEYGKYLGFMLSEVSANYELEKARDLANTKLRETIALKRKEAALGRIEESEGEGRDEAYAALSQAVSGSIRKQVVTGHDKNGKEIKTWTNDQEATTRLLRDLTKMAQAQKMTAGEVEKALADAGLNIYEKSNGKQRINAYGANLRNLVMNYRDEYQAVQSKIKDVETQFDVEASIDREEAQGKLKEQFKASEKNYADLETSYAKAQGDARKQAAANLLKQADTLEEMISAAPNYYDLSNDTEKAAYEKFVTDTQKRIDGIKGQRESLLKEAGALYKSRKTVQGETTTSLTSTSPWGGNAPAESTDYAMWDVNELVARRNQMDKFKNVLKPDTDIRAVLAEDKALMKALDNGLKEDWKSVLEWYNTERKKIQEELKSERFSTNEGHWRDEKQGRSRKNHFRESDYALAELDRYYSKRKEELEKARIEENMSEELFNRQAELLEQEHLERRSKLRETFTAGNTKAEKEMVKQFREWWSKLEKDGKLDEVPWATVESEWAKALASEIGRNNLKAQQDLTQMQQITVKHLNKIADIIAKERPYDGIVDNLRKNLTEMDILFADMEKKGVTDAAKLVKAEAERMRFLLGEAENAYALTFDELAKKMRENGLGEWADELMIDDQKKQSIIEALHKVYDDVQNAIKKEAAQIKKNVDIMWQDVMPGQKMSLKDSYEIAISKLGVQQDSVNRANSLIGAGAASERVADKLAIKQLQLKISMQEHYYNLMEQEGRKRIAFLEREADLEKKKAERLKKESEELKQQGKLEEAQLKARLAEEAVTKSTEAALDAQHLTTSLNISQAKELTEIEKQRNEMIARTEESQNRLYTSLKEWGDLLANSVREVMEASHAGDAEYYNERAKMDLTGKGGPGAGTYIVIDNEGTEDAKAHYEYLDESQALERQHEIERENAQAEAWKKVMDDLNAKMNEQITDWINAQLQNQAVYDNTAALRANTEVLKLMSEKTAESTDALAKNTDVTAKAGATPAAAPVVIPAADAAGASAGEKKTGTIVIEPLEHEVMPNDAPDGTQTNPLAVKIVSADGTDVVPPTVNGETTENVPAYLRRPEEMQPETPSYTPEWQQPTQQQGEQQQGWQAPMLPPATDDTAMYGAPWAAMADASDKATKKITENDKKAQKSSKSSFAAMTAAANMYGIAYQTMANDNLSTAQKVEMMIVQAAGQAAISMLTANLAASTGDTAANAPSWVSKTLAQMGPYAGPVAIGVFTALIGGLMGLATSKISKSKQQIAQATGASASAGKLATGMQTYAEGNVNEFTDPGSLTPGRQYNVDGADGRTYRARYMGKDAKTHITNGAEFHLVGEKGREAIIDAHTTRNIQLNEPEIWGAIKTLYNGGSLSHTPMRRGRGVRAFAEGNIEEFEDNAQGTMHNAQGTMRNAQGTMDNAQSGFTPEMAASMMAALDRNSAVMEQIMANGIEAFVSPYGPRGVVAGYDKAKKEAMRHGEKYL